MTHGGQKRAFGRAGRFGGLFGLTRFFLGPQPLADFLLELDVGLCQVGRALGHALFQGAYQCVHARGHSIKAIGKLAQLVGAVDAGAYLQVASPQRAGGSGQLDHVAGNGIVERQADTTRQCHRRHYRHRQQCGRYPAGPGDPIARTLGFGAGQGDQLFRDGIHRLRLQIKFVEFVADLYVEQQDLVGHRQVLIQ